MVFFLKQNPEIQIMKCIFEEKMPEVMFFARTLEVFVTFGKVTTGLAFI